MIKPQKRYNLPCQRCTEMYYGMKTSKYCLECREDVKNERVRLRRQAKKLAERNYE